MPFFNISGNSPWRPVWRLVTLTTTYDLLGLPWCSTTSPHMTCALLKEWSTIQTERSWAMHHLRDYQVKTADACLPTESSEAVFKTCRSQTGLFKSGVDTVYIDSWINDIIETWYDTSPISAADLCTGMMKCEVLNCNKHGEFKSLI